MKQPGFDEAALAGLGGVWQGRVPADGELRVLQGRVWMTRCGEPEDHVLAAGQTLALRAGDRLVAEPWVAGQVVRLQWQAAGQPQGLAARLLRPLLVGVAALARRGAAGLLALARSAEASASRAQGAI